VEGVAESPGSFRVEGKADPRAGKQLIDKSPPSPRRVRRRYHFGTPGITYVFVTVLIALGAFNSQNNLLFWAFGFSLALLIVSGLLSGAMLMGIDLERLGVDEARVGERTAIGYRLRNRNRFIPAFALSIVEVDRRVSWTASRRTRQAADSVNWPVHLTVPRAFAAHVGAGQSVVAEAGVYGIRRGRARLSGVLVSTAFPFGIIKKSLLFEQEDHLIVHPARIQADASLLRQAARLGERGSMPTRRAGTGAEFFSLREYRAGDAMKSIAWSASARRGELLVRQPAAPSPIRVIIALDFGAQSASGSASGSAADEHAICAAAALIDVASQHGLEVGLRIPSASIDVRAREGRLHRRQLLDELAVVDTRGARLDPNAPARVENPSERAALIIVHAAAPSSWASSVAGALHVQASEIGVQAAREAPRKSAIASHPPRAAEVAP